MGLFGKKGEKQDKGKKIKIINHSLSPSFIDFPIDEDLWGKLMLDDSAHDAIHSVPLVGDEQGLQENEVLKYHIKFSEKKFEKIFKSDTSQNKKYSGAFLLTNYRLIFVSDLGYANIGFLGIGSSLESRAVMYLPLRHDGDEIIKERKNKIWLSLPCKYGVHTTKKDLRKSGNNETFTMCFFENGEPLMKPYSIGIVNLSDMPVGTKAKITDILNSAEPLPLCCARIYQPFQLSSIDIYNKPPFDKSLQARTTLL